MGVNHTMLISYGSFDRGEKLGSVYGKGEVSMDLFSLFEKTKSHLKAYFTI